MSAEEQVFQCEDLRLYILQYAIDKKKMERNKSCPTKCREHIDYKTESCIFNIVCCVLCCFCAGPAPGLFHP